MISKRHWMPIIAVLLLAGLACTAPNAASVEQTANAAQQTVVAAATIGYGQITPQDYQASEVAGTVMAIYVQQTLAAQAPAATITAQPVAITDTPLPPTETPASVGTITGKVCYPAGGIPPLTIYITALAGGGVFSFPNPPDVSTYSASVPAGNYTAFAYPTIPFDPADSLVGGYTQFVPCGLDASTCSDHTLIEVVVYANQTTSGVDICDWQSDPGVLPPRP